MAQRKIEHDPAARSKLQTANLRKLLLEAERKREALRHQGTLGSIVSDILSAGPISTVEALRTILSDDVAD